MLYLTFFFFLDSPSSFIETFFGDASSGRAKPRACSKNLHDFTVPYKDIKVYK